MNRYTSGEYWKTNNHADYSKVGGHHKSAAAIRMLQKHSITPKSITDVGCGRGWHLANISEAFEAKGVGWDIAVHPNLHSSERTELKVGDAFESASRSDLVMSFDVAEHVEDYFGFFRKCHELGTHQIYHWPLDMFVANVLRDGFDKSRERVGHLHYFTKSTALATLRDTNHTIIDSEFCPTWGPPWTLRKRVAYLPRKLVSLKSTDLATRIFGGWSLIVLCK